MTIPNQILLAWGQKVSPRFCQNVFRICGEFGWTSDHADWLMACIAFESAETFRADIRNAAGSGAIGLIQFMPKTISALGYAMREIELMTPEEQLEVVKAYFRPYHRRIKTLSDMYMAILLPKYIGKADSSVLFSRGAGYRQNAGLDKNNDGEITKGEATAKVREKLRKGSGLLYASLVTLEA
jgi:spore maturation protein SpmB